MAEIDTLEPLKRLRQRLAASRGLTQPLSDEQVLAEDLAAYQGVQQAEQAMPTPEQITEGRQQAGLYGAIGEGLSQAMETLTGAPQIKDAGQRIAGSYEQKLAEQRNKLKELREGLAGRRTEIMEEFKATTPAKTATARARQLTVRGPQVRQHLANLGYTQEEIAGIDTTQAHVFMTDASGQPTTYGGVAPKLSVEEDLAKGRRAKEAAEDVKDEEAFEAAAAEAQSFDELADQLTSMKKSTDWTGPVKGRVVSLAAQLGISVDAAASELNARLKNSLSNYIKNRSGLTVSEQEFRRLQQSFPDISDSDEMFEAKMRGLKKELSRMAREQKLKTKEGGAGGGLKSEVPGKTLSPAKWEALKNAKANVGKTEQLKEALKAKGYDVEGLK